MQAYQNQFITHWSPYNNGQINNMNSTQKITAEQREELLGFLKYTDKLPGINTSAYKHLKKTLTSYLDDLLHNNCQQFLLLLKQVNILEKELLSIVAKRKSQQLSYAQIAADLILEKQNERYNNWKTIK